MRTLCRALVCVWFACVSALASAQLAVPPLAGRVNDLTGVLSAEARQDLSTRLAAIERDKGSQVAILVVPSVQPEDIAAFGIRVADAWKLGRADADDGAIILVALQDRVLRIEVGRGLEGAVPDAIAKRIVADDITPYFRRGDFHGGLALGVSRLAERIGAEALPPPTPADEPASLPGPLWLIGLFFVLLALGTVFSDRSAYYSSGTRRGGGVFLPPGGGGWGGGSRGGGGFRGGGGGFGGGGASGGW